MKRTLIVAVLVGFIAVFNGWIAEHISPAFRIPESVAEDVAQEIESFDTADKTATVVVSEVATVSKVIDGDTVEVLLAGGEVALVRYIGIDTPERATDTAVEECFYQEATARNMELVSGAVVRLVKDVSDTDRYGRLLRYVYVGDELINQTLVAEGFARAIRIEPDTGRYLELKAAEDQAATAKAGLWGTCRS